MASVTTVTSGIYGIVTCVNGVATKVAKPGCETNNIKEYKITKNIDCEYVIKHKLQNTNLIMKSYPHVVVLDKLSLTQFITLIKQLQIGLSHIHAAGSVHMDIKPTNLLLDSDGNLKIADFGVSEPIDSKISKVVGSRFFRAPEVYEGTHATISPAQDIWAVGILIHCYYRKPFQCNKNTNINAQWIKLLTNDHPQNTNDAEIYSQLLSISDKFDTYVNNLANTIDPTLANIMCLCLKLNPDDRRI